MRYRSKTEIISQILETANGAADVTRTRLMYRVFLSSAQLREYLEVLTENELLSYDCVTRTFKITQKGLKFLHLCKMIDELMVEEGEEQEQQEEQQVWVRMDTQGITNT